MAPIFLTSALDGGEWSTSRPGFFTPENNPLNRRLSWPHSRLDRSGKDTNALLLQGFERRIVQTVAY